ALYVGDIYAVDVLGSRAAGLVPCLLDPLGRYARADCARVANLSELAGRLTSRR
ncbi:MAG: HAD family hydrolase, partial [Myxococcales bacterium]|nr:HAD family hydrolase [Myxococcales bacterium]